MPYVIISLTPFYLFGMGLLFYRPKYIDYLSLYTIIGIGIILLYSLSLLLPLSFALMIGLIFMLIGYIKIIKNQIVIQLKYKNNLLLLILFFIYVHLIISVPVNEWDASFIWYFASKVIFYEGIVLNWDKVIYLNTPGYPKLIPTFAAHYGSLIGVWNELFPGSILIIFCFHTLIGFIAFTSVEKVSNIFILLIFLTLGRYIWNFYMDAYFALYFAIATVFMSKYVIHKNNEYYFAFIVTIGIFLNIKNEGILAMLCIMLVYIFIYCKINFVKLNVYNIIDKKIISFFYCMVPFIIWTIYKFYMDIPSGGLISQENFNYIWVRLTNHLQFILTEMLFVKFKYNYVFILIIFHFVLITISLYLNLKIDLYYKLIISVSIIYVLGLLFVYLGTTYGGGGFSGLKLHLDQSLERTMFPFMVMNYCSLALLLKNIYKRIISKESVC